MQKGLDLLLRGLAAPMLDGIRLVLVGPDQRGSRRVIEGLVEDMNLSDRVVLWGPAFGRDKFELIAGADFFVHTSRWEGLSFAVVEAMATGKPCLLTPAADPLGLVGRYAAGLVVHPTPDAIATGLQDMAAMDESTLFAAGQRARSIVEQHLSWSRIAEQLADAYATHREVRA
jgi:glycosyltransferase involved in cell wall biosynthesis